ncbi:MAG: hypothetical protein O2856_00490 [Planctomycetota bacterium]|nr:hypothetical protein [Planctomycetota bacterium]
MTFPRWTQITLAALITTSTMATLTAVLGDDEKPKKTTAEEKPDKTEKKTEAKSDKKKVEETVEVKVGELGLKLPKSWVQDDATRPMRLATFAVPAVEGDSEKTEFVISSFGGGGGGVDANITRWIGQFAADGREAVVVQGKAGENVYFIANISGTYMKSAGGPFSGKTTPTPSQRAINVFLNLNDKAVYFLKLTGPDATVAAQLDAVRASFGGKLDSEKEFEF